MQISEFIKNGKVNITKSIGIEKGYIHEKLFRMWP